MENNTIEKHYDEIDAEEIMQKIREKIYCRKTGGEISRDPDALILSLCSGETIAGLDESLQRDLSVVNSIWDLQNSGYQISSHHKFFGKFLVKGRGLVHGEVRRYVDPIFSRQTRFNASTVRLLGGNLHLYTELENAVSRLNQETDQ
jgi:O-antigen chain-terminating methyltransferase